MTLSEISPEPATPCTLRYILFLQTLLFNSNVLNVILKKNCPLHKLYWINKIVQIRCGSIYNLCNGQFFQYNIQDVLRYILFPQTLLYNNNVLKYSARPLDLCNSEISPEPATPCTYKIQVLFRVTSCNYKTLKATGCHIVTKGSLIHISFLPCLFSSYHMWSSITSYKLIWSKHYANVLFTCTVIIKLLNWSTE